MCGIAGKLFFDRNHKIQEGLIQRMCDTLIHRGPDDKGYLEDYNFSFGMQRLSIIDIEGGHQPIFNEDQSLSIIGNGEIYNHKVLRQELKNLGHRFRTRSDTEVVLHAYEQFGKDCLRRLNGMFAFAIWDSKNQELFMARDRLGIKPLYYFRDESQLLFGSELKAILADDSISRKLSVPAMEMYFSFGYVPDPWTMFEGLNKLSPGHFLFHSDMGTEIQRYWDPLDNGIDETKSLDEYVEEFYALFDDSVKLRMQSDVSYGAFLSGGIDSSLIVATMSELSDEPVKTFTIGFKEGGYHDESAYAQIIADQYQTDHHVFNIEADVVDMMETYLHHFDEPFADYAAFPTYAISQKAREHVKVVLTGDGCDEIFAGYERYGSEYMARHYNRVPKLVRKGMLMPAFQLGKRLAVKKRSLNNFFTGAVKKTELMDLSDDDRYIEGLYYFSEAKKEMLIQNRLPEASQVSLNAYRRHLGETNTLDYLDRRLYLDTKTSLPENMLTKVDRMTMASSLEARVPFLDHRLVEFAMRLPSEHKMDIWNLKKFVRTAAKRRLPESIIKRPKHGFSSPMNEWIRTPLKSMVQERLSVDRLSEQGLLNEDYVAQLVTSHMEGRSNVGKEIFMLMVFQNWLERYL